MKILFLGFFLLMFNLGISQLRIDNKSKILTIEASKSTAWFLRDKNVKFFLEPSPLPSGGNISYSISGNYIGLGYDEVNYFISPKSFLQGDVDERYCRVASIYYGKRFISDKSKINIIPTVHASFRYGYESIVMSEGNFNHDYYYINFGYNSPGIGVGFQISKILFKQFQISTELNYSHFFDKKEPYGSSGWGDFVENYKVNNHVLQFNFKIGIILFKN